MNLTPRSTLRLALAAAFAVSTVGFAHAQMSGMNMPQQKPGQPPLSPPAHAEAVLDGKKVTIDYSAPSVRGRKVFGELQKFGQVWRLGANAATTLSTETPLTLGDVKVPAGKYTLYAIPEESKPFTLIVNKQTGQWGTVYDEKQDLGRTPMKSATLPSSQEKMSLSFEHVQGKEAELHMRWATRDEWVPVKAE